MSRPPTPARAPSGGKADSAPEAAWLRSCLDLLFSRIRDRWRSYYPERTEGPPEVLLVRYRPVGFSVLLEIALRFPPPGGEVRLIAKIRRESRDGEFRGGEVASRALELARTEFGELTRAHGYLSQHAPDLAVVRPLDHFEDLNTMLIEKAAGRDLGVLVRRGDPDLVLHFRRAGRWLRAYHTAIHPPEARPFDQAGYFRRVQKSVGSLEELGPDRSLLRGLSEEVRGAAAAGSWGELPVSVLHGDYKLRHIWARPGGIQVLDFGNVFHGECCRDLAAMLVELDALDLWRPPWRPRRAGRLAAPFLEGYFGGEPPPPALALFVIEYLLKKWVRRRRRWSASPLARAAQAGLASIGLGGAVGRSYLDPWFEARIRLRLRELSAPA